MADQSLAQPQTSTSTTMGIFALLSARTGVTREEVRAIMPAEIRATVQLYLDGKIREWYSREDVAEARAIMEALPLAQAHLLDHEYIPVGPLMPLGLVLANTPVEQ